MEQSVFKVFFSKKKETEWLNNMGHSGFYLSYINVGITVYYFSVIDVCESTYEKFALFHIAPLSRILIYLIYEYYTTISVQMQTKKYK